MKNRQIAALFLCGIMSLSLLAGCASNTADADNSQNDNAQTTEDGMKALYLSEQGIFSAGGITVTSDGVPPRLRPVPHGLDDYPGWPGGLVESVPPQRPQRVPH